MHAHATIANDLVVAFLWMHNNFVPPAPEPIPMPSLDCPSTQKWMTTCAAKLTTTVKHRGQVIVQAEHDVGPGIIHLATPTTPLTALAMLFSQRKPQFCARKVFAEGKALVLGDMFPLLDCGDPMKSPLCLSFGSMNNSLAIGFDRVDVFAGLFAILRDYVTDLIIKRFERKLNINETFKWLGGLSTSMRILKKYNPLGELAGLTTKVLSRRLFQDFLHHMSHDAAQAFVSGFIRKSFFWQRPLLVKLVAKGVSDALGGFVQCKSEIEVKFKFGPEFLKFELGFSFDRQAIVPCDEPTHNVATKGILRGNAWDWRYDHLTPASPNAQPPNATLNAAPQDLQQAMQGGPTQAALPRPPATSSPSASIGNRLPTNPAAAQSVASPANNLPTSTAHSMSKMPALPVLG